MTQKNKFFLCYPEKSLREILPTDKKTNCCNCKSELILTPKGAEKLALGWNPICSEIECLKKFVEA